MTADLLAGNIAAHWIQAAALAASALVAMRLLLLHEPRARLAALHLTLAAIVLLPAVQPWTPDEPALVATPSANAIDMTAMTSEAVATVPQRALPNVEPAVAAVMLVTAGIAIRLMWLFYGVVRLARFSRRASTVPTSGVAAALEAELGVSPRYIQQTGSRGPWTFGLFRPTVALPAGFDALAPAFQRAVICHELVHVKRRDMAVAFLEELAVAALWFHPWIWLLRARIRVAREQIVDRRVVAILGNREEYVRCLVDLSGHDLAPHFSQAGAGMLRPRELRARVDAIFQEVRMSRLRFAVAACAFAAVTVATGLVAVAAMPLRAAAFATQTPAAEPLPVLVTRYLTEGASSIPISWRAAPPPQAAPDAPRKQVNTVYPEYPQDALERGIRGTVVVDITVNAAGDVTTAAVASGPQELRASAFKAALQLKYTKGSSTTTMKVAFHYMLTGTSWGVRIDAGLTNMGPRFLGAGQSGVETATTLLKNPDETGAYRVGGALQPPKKVKDVPPTYPQIAQAARVQGVVIMEARIDEHGLVSDVRTLRSIPLLDQAAIDAVKQWQYTPTLMNGVAVPVRMTVTVSFTLREPTSGTFIHLQLFRPDGREFMNGEVPDNVRVLIDVPNVEKFHLTASRQQDSGDVKVSFFDEALSTHLGDVVLTANGPLLQSPTNPAFGIQLLGVRSRVNIP